ncbi:microcystin-dependent protein [Nitrosomonas sp. Nm84]|uniref:phage tail protein n=1 Tax=Nitrosomonas sp. Nm84 TaxID=200124 RepID=UPI000D75A461|nr:tail fiber protein [Nitrosomonas sp. Nm84]PXW83900.1 microcystin-dependent protein [Nitrosomonas sp. Nm84]
MKFTKKTQGFFTVTTAMALLAAMPDNATAGMEPFIGEINYVAFNFAPRGWLPCNGQLLPINQYSAMFALLGVTYGGDGVSTFALPDMRGKVPVHQGQSAGGSNFAMGQTAGSESITLTANQMPTHSHQVNATSISTSVVAPGASATSTLKAVNAAGDTNTPGSGAIAMSPALTKIYSSTTAPSVSMNQASIETTLSGVNVATTTVTTATAGPAGGSLPFSIMQPYNTVNCIIAVEGIFPSRP